MVQVHRVTLLIVDHDKLGAAAVKNVLEHRAQRAGARDARGGVVG
jgi:hypothetical protein